MLEPEELGVNLSLTRHNVVMIQLADPSASPPLRHFICGRLPGLWLSMTGGSLCSTVFKAALDVTVLLLDANNDGGGLIAIVASNYPLSKQFHGENTQHSRGFELEETLKII